MFKLKWLNKLKSLFKLKLSNSVVNGADFYAIIPGSSPVQDNFIINFFYSKSLLTIIIIRLLYY